jgi:hypothetical protein
VNLLAIELAGSTIRVYRLANGQNPQTFYSPVFASSDGHIGTFKVKKKNEISARLV